MKKILWCLLLCMVLTGCSSGKPEERMTRLRSRFLGSGCEFSATVTADYGRTVCTFSMDCRGQSDGDLTFTVTAPEEIAGISGRVAEGSGALLFDGQALGFPLLADGELSPAGAPWVLLQTLRSGCLRSIAHTGGGMQMDIDDRYEERAVTLTIQTDGEGIPLEAEFLWEGRRILAMTIGSFRFV